MRCLLSTVDWSVAVISTSNPKVKMASGSSQRFTCRTSKSIKKTVPKEVGLLMTETDLQDWSKLLRQLTVTVELLQFYYVTYLQ